MTQEVENKGINFPTRALIDSDVLRYEMGSLTEEHPFLPDKRSPVGIQFLEARLEDKIQLIIALSGCKEYLFYFSEGGNFRFDLAKQQPYKGNREGFEKPFHWKTVDDYIKRNYPYVEIKGREADDALAEEQRTHGTDTIICTRDKDLLITPGWHCRWGCGKNQLPVPPHYIDILDSWRNFFFQMLIGDSTDNIPGCGERVEMMWGGKPCLRRKGIGKTAAAKLLGQVKEVQTMYQIVRMEYYKQFEELWEEKMLENARLLFVGQKEDDLFDWTWLTKEWVDATGS